VIRNPFARFHRAQAPAGSRVYAIGDIHGRADLLAALHRMICDDAAARPVARHVVVYVGDYIDRGPDSRAVIDLLLDAPLAGFESVHLLGNHEAFLLEFLDDAGAGPDWLFNGGAETLASYGVESPWPFGDPPDRMQAEFRRRLPARHLTFLRDLRLSHVEGGYLFVHAGVRPGVPLDRQERHDLLWIRDEFLDSGADLGKVVVHGHSIADEPERRRNRIGIDTGAYMTGRLTCLVLEGADRRFLAT